MTVHECTMLAQIPLSQWVNENPEYTIREWSCRSASGERSA